MEKRVDILLVEDNPADADLTIESLESAKILTHIEVVPDGVEAMAYLRKEGQYADKTRPDLILLDLNLPKKDGREVLAEIKQDDALKQIPVVVLTSSDAESDIAQVYASHAACYVTKPVNLQGFMEIVKAIEYFWFTVVTFPPKD